MVMKMNRTGFMNEIEKKTNLNKEQLSILDNILEENSIFGRKNKDKTVEAIMNGLNVDKQKANELYNTISSIAVENIKEKIKHPFKD